MNIYQKPKKNLKKLINANTETRTQIPTMISRVSDILHEGNRRAMNLG